MSQSEQKTALTSGRQLKVGECKTIFKARRNPLQDKTDLIKLEEMRENVFEYSLMTRQQFSLFKDVAEFTAYYYPDVTDPKKYCNLTRLMQYLFIPDFQDKANPHESEKIWDQFLSCLSLVEDKSAKVSVRPVWWKPYITGFYLAIEEICSDFEQDQRRRVANTYRQYSTETQNLNKLIKQGHVVTNFDQLFKIKVDTIGVRVVLQHNEYACGLHLTDEEWSDPLLNRYMDHAAILIIINDDITVHKRLVAEEDKYLPFNCVALAMKWNGWSQSAAIDHTFEIFQDYERKTKKIKRQLLDRSGNSEDLNKFIECVDLGIGGDVYVHQVIEYYNQVPLMPN